MDSSKKLAQSAHKILKELGYTNVSQGHVYELFAKLSGHASWNVSKTQGGFQPVINQLTADSVGEGNYEVKITSEVTGEFGRNIELKKYYRVIASSAEEANKIVSAYIEFRADDELTHLLEIPGVQELLDSEDEEEYKNKNWEVIWNDVTPSVQEKSTSSVDSHFKKTIELASKSSIEKKFKIRSFTKRFIEDVISVSQQVIFGESEAPKKFHDSYIGLLLINSNYDESIASDGSLLVSESVLTGVLDVVGGFYASVDLGFKKNYEGFTKAAMDNAESMLKLSMEALKEAQSQGYKHPNMKNSDFGNVVYLKQ